MYMRELMSDIFGEPTYFYLSGDKTSSFLMRLLLVPSSFNVGRCAITAFGARELY